MLKLSGREEVSFLKDYRDALGQLRGVGWELDTVLQSNIKMYRIINPDDLSWSHLYEIPLQDLVHRLTLLSKADGVHQTASEAGDYAAMMGLLTAYVDAVEADDDLDESQYDLLQLYLHHRALSHSLDCLMTYDCYLDELIAVVREGRDDANNAALTTAIRMDHSVITAPTVSRMIAKAEQIGDKAFFRRIAKALTTDPDPKRTDYPDLRAILPIIEKLGWLKSLSLKEKYELLVHELKVYPDSDDAEQSVNQFIYRWLKSRRFTQTVPVV